MSFVIKLPVPMCAPKKVQEGEFCTGEKSYRFPDIGTSNFYAWDKEDVVNEVLRNPRFLIDEMTKADKNIWVEQHNAFHFGEMLIEGFKFMPSHDSALTLEMFDKYFSFFFVPNKSPLKLSTFFVRLVMPRIQSVTAKNYVMNRLKPWFKYKNFLTMVTKCFPGVVWYLERAEVPKMSLTKKRYAWAEALKVDCRVILQLPKKKELRSYVLNKFGNIQRCHTQRRCLAPLYFQISEEMNSIRAVVVCFFNVGRELFPKAIQIQVFSYLGLAQRYPRPAAYKQWPVFALKRIAEWQPKKTVEAAIKMRPLKRKRKSRA